MPNKKIPSTGNAALDLAMDTIKIGKQALVFVNTKRSAEKTAEDISKKVKTENEELIVLSKDVLKALSSHTKQCQRISDCVKKGIAFHHAGLVAKQRELIEDNFRKGWIKIISDVSKTRGSGWTMLYYDKDGGNKPFIIGWTDEHHIGSFSSLPVILALDCWEHAYMVDYLPGERGKYVEAYLGAVNWDVVNGWFEKAQNM